VERVTIEIEDVSFEGQGIGKHNGLAFFVEDTLPGDLVEVIPTKMKKRYAFGKRLSLVEPSKDRIDPLCPHESECGGCTFQRYSYDAQLKLKEKQIREKLVRLAGIENPLVRPMVGMDNPFEYRNKATLQVAASLGSVGYFEKKSHHVVDVPYCMLQAAPANAVSQVIREYIRENHTTIIQLIVKTAAHTGEVMVVIIAEKSTLPKEDILIMQINEAVESLEHSKDGVQYSLENVTLKEKGKDKGILLAGTPIIHEELLGMEFEISSNSFYQVNTDQAGKLFEKALDYAELKGEEHVLDLYCGVGTIGLLAAKRAKGVLGIE
jgi:23S rRNA (uracil1939-C5)-methyltransferase